jgi:hypothetical protein
MAFNLKALAARMKITVPSITPSPAMVKPWEITRSTAFYWQAWLRDQPLAFVEIVQRARYYARNNAWMKTFLKLKVSVFNHGVRIKAASGTEEDQKKLDAWMAEDWTTPVDWMETLDTREKIMIESTQKNRDAVRKFIRDTWMEWFICDNCLGFWLDERKQATLMPPERSLYSNSMGLETIRYIHSLNYYQIRQLPEAQQKRFMATPNVYLNPLFGEHWKLLKRSIDGEGFEMPSMLPLFRVLGEEESKEMGLHELAWLMRNVTRHHKIGGEYKGFPESPDWPQFYRWTRERSDQIMGSWKDVIGSNDYVSGHDHEITYPWPEIKTFDKTLFEGSGLRLQRWGGPLATMTMATQLMPYLGQLLQAEATYEREEFIAPFVEWCINHAMQPPVEIKVEFGNGIFLTHQLRNEMLKFSSLQGDVSAKSRLDALGLDATAEAYAKVEMAEDPEAKKKYMPMYDSAHGTSPALDGAAKPKDPNATGAKGQGAGAKPGTPVGGVHAS